MLIFSKDRKKIVDCISVAVSRNYGGGREAKFSLVGSGGIGTTLDGSGLLASYPDEKTAMDELEKIFAAFEGGAKTYRL